MSIIQAFVRREANSGIFGNRPSSDPSKVMLHRGLPGRNGIQGGRSRSIPLRVGNPADIPPIIRGPPKRPTPPTPLPKPTGPPKPSSKPAAASQPSSKPSQGASKRTAKSPPKRSTEPAKTPGNRPGEPPAPSKPLPKPASPPKPTPAVASSPTCPEIAVTPPKSVPTVASSPKPAAPVASSPKRPEGTAPPPSVPTLASTPKAAPTAASSPKRPEVAATTPGVPSAVGRPVKPASPLQPPPVLQGAPSRATGLVNPPRRPTGSSGVGANEATSAQTRPSMPARGRDSGPAKSGDAAWLRSFVLGAAPQQEFQAKRPLDSHGKQMFGAAGKPIPVLTNHFKTNLGAADIYHYDVVIASARTGAKTSQSDTKAAPPRSMSSRVSKLVIQSLALKDDWGMCYAYDGRSNLYATKSTLFDSYPERHEVTVVDTKDGKPAESTFHVTLTRVKDMSTLELLDWFDKQQGAGEGAAGDDQGSGKGLEYPQYVSQALEVAMKFASGSVMKDRVAIGRAVYTTGGAQSEEKDLFEGCVAYPGFVKGLSPTGMGLSLNVDAVASPFWKGKNLADLFAEVLRVRDVTQLNKQLRNRPLTDEEFGKLEKIIKNPTLLCRETHRGASPNPRTAFRLLKKSANDFKFILKEGGKTVSVAKYFEDKYHKLKYPSLPLVDLSSDPKKPLLVPPEVLVAEVGQRRNAKLSPSQQAALVKFAAVPPKQRKASVEDFVEQLTQSSDADQLLKQFGITLEPKMQQIEGRVLRYPLLTYGKNTTVDPGPTGGWNLRKGLQLLNPVEGTINSWGVVSFVDQYDLEGGDKQGRLEGFRKELAATLKTLGLKAEMSSPPPVVYHDSQFSSVSQTMQKIATQASRQYKAAPQLIVVVMGERQEDEYAEVKRWSDTSSAVVDVNGRQVADAKGQPVLSPGIPTQCINFKKSGGLSPRNPGQYWANLALKINAKMGGVNWALQGSPSMLPVVGNKDVMVVGVDVTHFTSEATNAPSIGAVVGSLDCSSLGKWACSTFVMQPKQEIIQDIKEAAKQLLTDFRDANKGSLPGAIVVYRDGLSEGQMAQAFAHEFNQLRDAAMEMNEGKAIPITYVVATKRHNTRFFPRDPAQDADRSGNLPPGTVVDKSVTHPYFYDFFLQSHAGIQGTSKSVHYTVLVDEIGFAPDGLQIFTYWQTYTFCRATRSVSMVPAVYYAHLAAYRFRKFVTTVPGGAKNAPVQYSAPAIHPRRQTTMFYA